MNALTLAHSHTDDNDEQFQGFGLRPIGSIKMQPTLIKEVAPGTKIGYSSTYEATTGEWIATFPIGYADGVWRHLSSEPDSTFNGYVLRDKTGKRGKKEVMLGIGGRKRTRKEEGKLGLGAERVGT